MEQGVVVLEHNKKNDCSPLSKFSGSLIRIDTVSIDLASAIDKNQDANQCGHFSIRGYVADMRKKDITACLPFSNDDNKNKQLKQKIVLPPLNVVKSRWWSCDNCLRKIGTACCEQENEKLSDNVPSRFDSEGLCSNTLLFRDEIRGESVVACTKVSTDEIVTSACGYDKEKKDEVGQSIPDSAAPLCAENEAYHRIVPVAKDIGNCEASVIPERHVDVSDVMVFSGRSFRFSNIRHIENNGSNYSQIGQTETSDFATSQRRMEIQNSQTIRELSSLSIGNNIAVTKENTGASWSLDGLPSESGDINSKNYQHDKFEDRKYKSVSQRAPKIRLLTEILDMGRNPISDKIQSDSESVSASDFCNDMVVRTNSKQHFTGKRKATQGENEKSKFLKEHANIVKRNCMVSDSDTEESVGILAQPKNLSNQLTTKKKHKQSQQDFRPDIDKKYHKFSYGGELSKPAHHMYSNNEMNLHDKSSISLPKAEGKPNMSKKKKEKMEVLKSFPVPRSSTMSNKGSLKRKKIDTCRRKDVDLSLNNHGAAQIDKEGNIGKGIIRAEPLLSYISTGELSVMRKSTPDIGYQKGLLCDLNDSIATKSSADDMQNINPRVESIQRHRELNISGTCFSEPKIDDQGKGDDDIPMEIVEWLAKIQYDRRQYESKRNYFPQEQINAKRNFESMNINSVDGNRVLKSYPVEDHSVRKLRSPTTTVKSSDHLAKANLNCLFPDFNQTSLNMNKMEENRSAFAEYSSFFNTQGTQSGGISDTNSGYIRNGRFQDFPWRSDHKYTILPQSNGPPMSNFGTCSSIPEALNRGKLARNIDLNLVNENHNNFEQHNSVFSSDVASRHRGIDLNTSVWGSSDLDSTETVPDMQLLSLIDAQNKSNPISSSFENRKIVSKPFSPCSYHSKLIASSPFLFDHHSKEPFGRAIGVSSNELRPPSSSSYGKVQRRDDNSCERPLPILNFGPFSSPIPNVSNLSEMGNAVPTRATFEGKKKGPEIINAKSRKPFRNRNYYNLIRANQREGWYMNGNFHPSQSVSSSEMCFVNRNPADFSTPKRGNVFMISGSDLKFGERISQKGKSCPGNLNGKKRQRVGVLTATKKQ